MLETDLCIVNLFVKMIAETYLFSAFTVYTRGYLLAHILARRHSGAAIRTCTLTTVYTTPASAASKNSDRDVRNGAATSSSDYRRSRVNARMVEKLLIEYE